ncbi:RagB/SusD domain-containing protein [Flavobacterium sp. 90]|uniref:RagB/SusD family nutrient uptake outer membrane protein n=1 Tax=unclassified Flavobacterium TaxID=196869 RepID=UPI000EB3DD64|nr:MULTISPECIES: RagB/SusD family nutrient uptake outer membrane protein [unclassified Flavobacterium]RKR08943.1 RagB/SusD domain-containing protein [Flavobacterium sp. 81]TCK52731.1 RagB/SusD domain-containing protein [Flavobacterium sp. 90]
MFINKLKNKVIVLFIFSMLTVLQSCESFTEIDPPKNALVKDDVFSDEKGANSAVLGIYYQLTSSSLGQGYTSVYLGLSADDMYRHTDDSPSRQLHINDIVANNDNVQVFWSSIYQVIGQANGTVEGLENNSNFPENKRLQFLAEAKFLRAYCYFYLVNLWGDVPLITSTKWSTTSKSVRIPKADVYTFILNDLLESVKNLPETASNNIRAKKSAATALLARVYLYQKNWAEAQKYAEMTIANTLGTGAALPNVGEVFFPNSSETIFQLQPPNNYTSSFESSLMNLFGADYLLEDNLLKEFEPGDLRRISWVGEDQGNFYAAKYTTSPYDSSGPPQYNVLLRAAEQYFIAAEAKANQNNISGAILDLNVIRNRAGISEIDPVGISQGECLLLIEKEKRLEFFAEWGHRWLDLNRTSRASAVLGALPNKNWNTDDMLYPIPISEIKLNPNLTQNKGY